MKKIKSIALTAFTAVVVFWFYSILKCEYLTWKHGSEFLFPKEVSSMIDGKSSKKVLEYSETYACVYYVSSESTSGDVISFVSIDGKWIFSGWKTIWSSSGSADEFIWPYIR